MKPKEQHPNIAPGSNELEDKATAEDIARRNTTRVTTLKLDEFDPSGERKS